MAGQSGWSSARRARPSTTAGSRQRRGLRLSLIGAGALARRPRLLAVFIRTRAMRYARAARKAATNAQTSTASRPADVAVLSHVAVDSELQGMGVGRKLVSAFLAELAAHNVDEARLITNVDSGAAAFYERLGWDRLVERPAADGAAVVEFRHRPMS